ncbi:MAG: hypothetical protein WKF96_14725 [Solirubrobacteraceae bacterium]
MGTAKKPAEHKRRAPEPGEVLLEAALAWVMRFDFKPNSVTWNATRAWKHGSDAWQRHLEGWVPRSTTGWRSWPQPQDVTVQFGSWKAFHKLLDDELERRRDRGNPYAPRPVPPKQARFATLAAHAREVIDARRNASEGNPITSMFVVTAAGLLDLRGDEIGEGVAIVGIPGTGRSNLLAGVVELDRLRYPPVVVVQRADMPLIAAGLPNSDLMDLEDAIRLGRGAIVRSNEPDVRLIAIGAAADVSAKLGRDVCIAVDDADDLIPSLAQFMIDRPPTAHMAIVWSPRDTEFDAFVWAALESRAVTAISDPVLDRRFRKGVDPDLLPSLGLPRTA